MDSAVLGSTLANVLDAAGFKVQKEYYINDSNQIVSFTVALFPLPAVPWYRYGNACRGLFRSYVTDLARELIDEHGDEFLKMPCDEAESKLGKLGLKKCS